ncbi:MAG: sulfotransferase [Sulfuricella sp.]|nr:sulfotransferase [Sulfuricella sp.]
MNAVGLAKIDLSEAALLAQARRETGLQRFGDESFLPAMRVFLGCLENETRLNPFGRLAVKARVLRSLKNRLWAQACFEKHPEILEQEIVAPIVVVGLGRSGTTRLQRLLAADTRLQHLKTWEGFNPAPRLDLADFGKTERREEIRKLLETGRRLNPGAAAAHPQQVDWAEEEILLINHSFCGLSSLGLHDYHQWYLRYDKTAAYRYMADLMKLVSWSRNETTKRWVLKTPQHMLDLDVLMKVFPDAQVVFIHRDPLKTVPSTMSLMWHFVYQSTDLPVRQAVQEVWLEMCEQMARRSMAIRETLPAAQQMDVYYEEMNRDWRAVMQRIYQFAGMEFTPAAQQAMADWLAESEQQGHHTGHRYALEDFGITREEVDARMMFYRERYAIPYEGKK